MTDMPYSASGLLKWITRPSEFAGVNILANSDDWLLSTYAELADRCRRIAVDLLDRGLQRGDVVIPFCETSDDFIAAFYGALMAGCTPCPVAAPGALEPKKRYLSRVGPLLNLASPSAIWASRGLSDIARELVVATDSPAALLDRIEARTGLAEPAPPADTALLQFTSGSSGHPKGVEISHHNLQSNIAIILNWLDVKVSDSFSTWVPFYHDMGLIGGILSPVTAGIRMWSMRPGQFLRSPEKWLDVVGRNAVNIATCPTFGLSHVIRKVRPDRLRGLDFSQWRAIVIGAERIDPACLRMFADMLRPYEFAEEALRPAYGMAEATLVVTGQPSRRPRAYRPKWDALGIGHSVVIQDMAYACDDKVGDGRGWLVGCGSPLAGCEVQVINDQGAQLGELMLGELVVKSPSVATGYRCASDEQQAALSGGTFRSGDAGFLIDGEVVVVGRIGDSLKVRATYVYAEDLEAQISSTLGIPVARVAVAMGIAEGIETVIVHIRSNISDEDRREVMKLLQWLDGDAKIRLVMGPQVPILRTSSGKTRRREMWYAATSSPNQVPGGIRGDGVSLAR